MICNISETSLHLGFRSRSTLQRLVQKGHLDGYRVPSDGREVLLQTAPPELPSLRETVRALTQYRPGSPLWERPNRPAATAPLSDLSDAELGAHCDQLMAGLDAALPELEEGPDWELVAEHLNGFLGGSWPAPPWDGDQVATVALCLEMSKECD